MENRPSDEIERLKWLSDFIAEPRYSKEFVAHLDNASLLLREELRMLLTVEPLGPSSAP
jgi:hypothetical protein